MKKGTLGHIQNIPAAVLPTIIAGLVREGIMFNCTPENDEGSTFNIELTGGY